MIVSLLISITTSRITSFVSVTTGSLLALIIMSRMRWMTSPARRSSSMMSMQDLAHLGQVGRRHRASGGPPEHCRGCPRAAD